LPATADASMASAAVDPDAIVTGISSWCSGPFRECIDERIADLFKEGSEHQVRRTAPELEIEFERHLATIITEILESPAAAQMPERAFDQRKIDGFEFVSLVACRKCLAERTFLQLECGFQLFIGSIDNPG
jgi:hypothetical protein